MNASDTPKQYVVLTNYANKECILGYIDPAYPHLFGVLSTSIIRGYNGDHLIWSIARHLIKSWRPATEQDFADYRVQTPSSLRAVVTA